MSRRKKYIFWFLASPFLLFLVLMGLVYLPPVQNYLVKKATTIATEQTGYNINIRRVRLGFPLHLIVKDVAVVDTTSTTSDSLLFIKSLSAHIGVMPLFKGNVDINGIKVKDVKLCSNDLIPGIKLKGKLGHFYLKSRGVKLKRDSALVNKVELSDLDLSIVLDSIGNSKEDSIKAAPWWVNVNKVALKNIKLDFSTTADSISVESKLSSLDINNVLVDQKVNAYSIGKIKLNELDIKYDQGAKDSLKGFDPKHINITDCKLMLNDAFFSNDEIRAELENASLKELSGLDINELTAKISTKNGVIHEKLNLKTDGSEIKINGNLSGNIMKSWKQWGVSLYVSSYLSPKDVLNLSRLINLDPKHRQYPNAKLLANLNLRANRKRLEVSNLNIKLPTAFNIKGQGYINNPLSNKRRGGNLSLSVNTEHIDFLRVMLNKKQQKKEDIYRIPDSINTNVNVSLKSDTAWITSNITLDKGQVNLTSTYNINNKKHSADIAISKFPLQKITPSLGISDINLLLREKGVGMDIFSSNTDISTLIMLHSIKYNSWDIRNINLKAGINSHKLKVDVNADNDILRINAKAETNIKEKNINGYCDIAVRRLNLIKLGLLDNSGAKNLGFDLNAKLNDKEAYVKLKSEDINLAFTSASSLDEFIEASKYTAQILKSQIEKRHIEVAIQIFLLS